MKKNLVILLCLAGSNIAAQNTGINTINPNMALHVVKADTALLQIDNPTALATNSSAGLYIKNGSYFTGAIKTIGTGNNVARLGFYTFAAGTTAGLKERLSIMDDGRVGINNNNPATTLDLNGTLRFTPGSEGNRKILTSNFNGDANWVYSDAISFSMTRVSTSGQVPTNTATTTPLNQLEYETYPATGGLNTANNTYTAPVAGLYHFDVSLEINPSGTGSDVGLTLQKNGNAVRYTYVRVPVSSTFVIAVSGDVPLVAGDVISIRLWNGTNNNIFVTNGQASYFNGHLIR